MRVVVALGWLIVAAPAVTVPPVGLAAAGAARAMAPPLQSAVRKTRARAVAPLRAAGRGAHAAPLLVSRGARRGAARFVLAMCSTFICSSISRVLPSEPADQMQEDGLAPLGVGVVARGVSREPAVELDLAGELRREIGADADARRFDMTDRIAGFEAPGHAMVVE